MLFLSGDFSLISRTGLILNKIREGFPLIPKKIPYINGFQGNRRNLDL